MKTRTGFRFRLVCQCGTDLGIGPTDPRLRRFVLIQRVPDLNGAIWQAECPRCGLAWTVEACRPDGPGVVP